MGRTTSQKSPWSPEEKKALARLDSPERIQSFLDGLSYNPEDSPFRCPRSVLRDRIAHCFEGAVFAAAALKQLGYPPLIINLYPEPGTDDEHLLALYRKNGAWGAVGKSNFVGLRAREPIYRTFRELLLSYFEQYYNVAKQKTLRTYTRPLNLAAFDKYEWLTSDETMNRIDKRLDALRRYPLLTRPMIQALRPVDEATYQSGLAGSNPAGLFAPLSHPI